MNIQFDNKINSGQLVTLVSALIVVVGLYYGTQAELSSKAYESEARDAELQLQITVQSSNAKHTAELIKEMQSEMKLNSEHRFRYDDHEK